MNDIIYSTTTVEGPAPTIINTTFKLRRGSSSDWSKVNPILAEGEPGVETDTLKLKIGNGIDEGYTDLLTNRYFSDVKPDDNDSSWQDAISKTAAIIYSNFFILFFISINKY